MQGNRILTIVVTYNGMKWIDRCLGSVYASGMPADVIVIDNGSSDGTPEYVGKQFPEAVLISTGENHGFGKANNIGFSYALEKGYDYVYLLNQDAWIFPDTFSRLVDAMEKNPDYGVISPVQMAASMERPDPRFAVKCLDRPLAEYVAGNVYEVPFVMAAHWMISRRCLETVGGFSPAFRHYGEDDNWLHRASFHGFRTGFLAGCVSVHDREMRPFEKAASMRLKCVASVVKVSNPLNCLPWRLIVQPMELLAISILRCSSDVLKFIVPFVRSYPELIDLRRRSKEKRAFL